MKTAKYVSLRPYNKLYVGVHLEEEGRTITDHFDKKNNDCWQGAISSILCNITKDEDVLYIDETKTNILFSKGSDKELIEKTLKISIK